MAGGFKAKYTANELNRSIQEILRHTPTKVEQVIRNESRLLVEELVDRTKPTNLSRLKERVERTYKRVFAQSIKGAGALDSTMLKQLYRAQAQKRWRLKPRILLQKTALEDAIKKAQSHCGFFAAGWFGIGNPLGAKRGIPNYVKKQAIQGKVGIDKSGDSIHITGVNLVAFMRHFPKIREAEERLLNAAMKTRIYKIGLNLRLIQLGKKSYRIPRS